MSDKLTFHKKKAKQEEDPAVQLEEEEESVTPGQLRMYVFSSVFLALVVCLCFLITVQVMTKGYASFMGFSCFRVVTGSMEPQIPVGTILLCKSEDIADIKRGDIVCFSSRAQSQRGMIITHRVVGIKTLENGEIRLETKGDANTVADTNPVDAQNLIGRVVWHTKERNGATNMLSFLGGNIGLLACVVFPVLLIAGLILQSAVRSIHKEMEEAMRALQEETSAPPAEEDLLPGFTTVTRKEFEEMYEQLKKEILEELYANLEGTDIKTE